MFPHFCVDVVITCYLQTTTYITWCFLWKVLRKKKTSTHHLQVGGFNPVENISQNGNLPQIGMNIKHIWNHQLVLFPSWDVIKFHPRFSGSGSDPLTTSPTAGGWSPKIQGKHMTVEFWLLTNLDLCWFMMFWCFWNQHQTCSTPVTLQNFYGSMPDSHVWSHREVAQGGCRNTWMITHFLSNILSMVSCWSFTCYALVLQIPC